MPRNEGPSDHSDMKWVETSTIVTGTFDRPQEVVVPGFWIDASPVTEAQFNQFLVVSGLAGPPIRHEGGGIAYGLCFSEALRYAECVKKSVPTDAELCAAFDSGAIEVVHALMDEPIELVTCTPRGADSVVVRWGPGQAGRYIPLPVDADRRALGEAGHNFTGLRCVIRTVALIDQRDSGLPLSPDAEPTPAVSTPRSRPTVVSYQSGSPRPAEYSAPATDWASLTIMCGGQEEYAHWPAAMLYERRGNGVRGGAIYRCTVCGGRKFVWRTAVLDNFSWEWKEHPRVKSK